MPLTSCKIQSSFLSLQRSASLILEWEQEGSSLKGIGRSKGAHDLCKTLTIVPMFTVTTSQLPVLEGGNLKITVLEDLVSCEDPLLACRSIRFNCS